MTTEIKCADCGKETSSYGVVGGKKICHGCCGERDRRELETGDEATVALIKEADGWKVKNWPGTMVFPATVEGNVVRFTDHKGQRWEGKRDADSPEVVRCRKVKGGSK